MKRNVTSDIILFIVRNLLRQPIFRRKMRTLKQSHRAGNCKRVFNMQLVAKDQKNEGPWGHYNFLERKSHNVKKTEWVPFSLVRFCMLR